MAANCYKLKLFWDKHTNVHRYIHCFQAEKKTVQCCFDCYSYFEFNGARKKCLRDLSVKIKMFPNKQFCTT